MQSSSFIHYDCFNSVRRQNEFESWRMISAYRYISPRRKKLPLKLLRLMNETPNIIVDCRFLPKLTNRALNLTANQMTFMHVENREKSWEFIHFFLLQVKAISVYPGLSSSPISMTHLRELSRSRRGENSGNFS